MMYNDIYAKMSTLQYDMLINAIHECILLHKIMKDKDWYVHLDESGNSLVTYGNPESGNGKYIFFSILSSCKDSFDDFDAEQYIFQYFMGGRYEKF